MKQPKNRSEKYTDLFSAIDKGQIKIPQFQRDFVWSKEQTAKLVDSILKGFPLGTFILWKTKARLRHIRNVGNIDLPEPDEGDSILYVLDGQQRITSLYAVRKGIRITRDNKEVDYRDICINLDLEPSDEDEVVFSEPVEDATCISLHQLLNASVGELAQNYSGHLDRVSDYKTRLEGYDFSTVVIEDYEIDVACEVFTRINTGGKELTLFEIMVAKTYDQDKEFDLAEQYQLLMENEEEKDLESVGFGSVPPVTVLQCVASFITPEIKRQNILKMEKDQFIDQWPLMRESLFTAIDYLRTHVGVAVSRMLPYNSILIPLTWFFRQIGNRGVDTRENQLLRQYIYFAGLTQRYSSAVETKIPIDIKRMKTIIEGGVPDYQGEMPRLTAEDLRNESFSVGNARSKMVICLLSELDPKSFRTNGKIVLDNRWLKASTSKNYHHFFPKAFLRTQGVPKWRTNSLMNIVLVDDYLNKRTIKAKAPSIYMAGFAKKNKNLTETLKSHAIGDLVEFGINRDDYETFLTKRSERICSMLEEILHPMDLSDN